MTDTTTTVQTPQYYYPNRMGRVILLAMEAAMGREHMLEVLKAANLEQLQKLPPSNLDKKFKFEWVSGLQEATEKVYGEKAGRQMNTRVGKLCFNSGLREFEPLLGITDLPLRIMPLGMKFRVGLEVFAKVFNLYSDQLVKLSEEGDDFLWLIERNPVCWNRHTSEPCCQLVIGILEEAIFWGTAGRRYKVEETDCIAIGAKNCVFRIDKQPLD